MQQVGGWDDYSPATEAPGERLLAEAAGQRALTQYSCVVAVRLGWPSALATAGVEPKQ